MSESGTSDPGRLLDQLFAASVLTDSADGGFELSDVFRSELESQEEKVRTSDDVFDSLHAEVPDETLSLEALLHFGDDCPDVLAEYLALAEATGLTHAERLRVLPLFDSFRSDGEPTDGVPNVFLPVSGFRLPFVVNMFKTAIVYVWKHDCSPCDLVRGDFDELFDAPPSDLGMFAVHGPSAAQFLYDTYRVDGAPTVLFFLDGEVDVRLRGAESRKVLETEIEKLRTVAEPTAE